MAQPPAYSRTKDFGADYPDQTDNQAINTELDAVASSITGIRTNLAKIQRDDGGLRDGIVTKDSLAQSLKDDLYAEFSGNINDSVLEAQQAAVEATNAAAAANADAATSVAARDEAQTAAATAQASAAAASASQAAATGSATAAANSASSASGSASSASGSASAASTAAATATNAASTASTSASTASTAASTATAAMNDAQTASSSATNSAAAAASSATLAQDWANKTGSPVAGGEYSAKHYANLAASQAGLRTFTTVPTTDQGAPVCVPPHGILYWDTTAGRYISAECGETRFFSVTAPPPGYIAEDNALLNVSDFPALFARIGTMYGGDGTTNFRAPEGRGEFLRGADMGRGVDAGRTVGSAQPATSIRSAPGANVAGDPVTLSPANMDSYSSAGSPALVGSNLGTSAITQFTTRPRNVARLACVKYQ